MVRPARPDDVPALQAIFRRASWSNVDDRPLLTEHPELLEWSGAPVESGRTSVAVVDGHVVGFVTTVARDDVLEVEDLFVDPEWMRRGAATALVEHARAAALRERRLALEVDANGSALAFYASAGFVVEGEVPLEYGTGVRMRLDARRPPSTR